jgi:hypothetical protein
MSTPLRKFSVEKDANPGDSATVTFTVPNGAVGAYFTNDATVDFKVRPGSSGGYAPFTGGEYTMYLEVGDIEQVQLHDQADTDVGACIAVADFR